MLRVHAVQFVGLRKRGKRLERCRWEALALPVQDDGHGGASDAAAVEGRETGSAKTKRARRREREAEEAATRRAELAKLEDAAPGSVDDFERLVLASPSSSYVWIRYMAFLLSMSEVEKARAVAERALKTIDYRCALAARCPRTDLLMPMRTLEEIHRCRIDGIYRRRTSAAVAVLTIGKKRMSGCMNVLQGTG
jgi:hypothetical protein